MLSGKFYGEEGAQGEEGMQVSPNLILIWVEFEGRSWQLGQSWNENFILALSQK
jgi:hypothetical protein